MSQDRPEVLTRSIQTTDVWLKELAQDLGVETPQQAYSALRPVLHALRDRLMVEQAANLAAQLPAMVVGIFCDGWSPESAPKKIRSREEFVEEVQSRAAQDGLSDPERAISAVFALLDRKLSPGAFAKVAAQLPDEVQSFYSQK